MTPETANPFALMNITVSSVRYARNSKGRVSCNDSGTTTKCSKSAVRSMTLPDSGRISVGSMNVMVRLCAEKAASSCSRRCLRGFGCLLL